jgi:superfamily I DNA/RNA helicase
LDIYRDEVVGVFVRFSCAASIYGGLSFYQRKEIKDVLCYLRLVINPKDEES